MHPGGFGWIPFMLPPLVITGRSTQKEKSMATSPTPDRSRLSVDLSPVVMSHLDHISEITGVTKAGIITSALLDALPDLLARADGLKKRHNELNQAKPKR